MRRAATRISALKSPRAWVLASLALAVLAFQFLFAFDILTDKHYPERFGFDAQPVDGIITVTSVRPWDTEFGPTSAYRSGLQKGDQILALKEGRGAFFRPSGLFDSATALRNLRGDREWTLLVRRAAASEVQDLELILPQAPSGAEKEGPSLQFVVSKIIFPTICIAVAILIGFLRPRDRSAFLASLLLFCFSGACWRGGTYATFPPGLREAGLLLYVVLFSSWSYCFARFFLLFPNPSPIERSAPWLKRVLVAFPVLFAAWNANWAITEALSWERFASFSVRFASFDILLDILFLILFALGFLSISLSLSEKASQTDRRRLKILLLGSLGMLPSLVLYFCNTVLWAPPPPNWVHNFSGAGLALFPILFSYAVVKHRLFGIRPILRRGLQFALLSRGFLFLEGAWIFLALFYAAGPLLVALLHGASTSTIALITAFLTMGAVLVIRRINAAFMHVIEKRFFREAYDGKRILTEFSGAVRRMTTQPLDLINFLAAKVFDSLHPTQVAVFIRGSELLKLPVSAEGFAGALAQLAEKAPKDFICLCWRTGPVVMAPGDRVRRATLLFRGNSLVAKQLEMLVAGDPAALDLDLDDPQSWAAPLRKAHPSMSGPQVELTLLAGYGVRLLIPLIASGRLMGFISLGERQSEEPYSGEDKELLLAVGQQVALALEHSEFLRQEAEEMNLRRELEIARGVQQRLFPQTLPPVAGLRYAGICHPAHGVGGDYYDFIYLGPGKLAVALGDVTGKGISAALLMASLQAMLRIHSEAHRNDPERLTADINRHMVNATHAERFASFFYGVLDTFAGTLTYVNAGHNPPMLFRTAPGMGRSLGAEAARDVDREACEVIRLNSTGMVLGVDSTATYRREVVSLCAGDLLLVFTDGITEAVNPHGEQYGEEALQSLVRTLVDLPPDQVMAKVIEDVRNHAGGEQQADDMTLLIASLGDGQPTTWNL